jgi:hypothetical protein
MAIIPCFLLQGFFSLFREGIESIKNEEKRIKPRNVERFARRTSISIEKAPCTKPNLADGERHVLLFSVIFTGNGDALHYIF